MNATRVGADPLARVVFALLVLASFAAFAVTQRLKHTPTAVQGIKLSPSLSPGSAGWIGRDHISFRIQHSGRVTVAVIDSQGDTVRTLTRARPLQAYRRVFLEWNGLLRGGRTAQSGTYRIRVSLLGQQHQVLSPSSFELTGGSGR